MLTPTPEGRSLRETTLTLDRIFQDYCGGLEPEAALQLSRLPAEAYNPLDPRKEQGGKKEELVMESSQLRKTLVILIHAFVGWAFCTATMVIGMALMPLQSALVAHAVAAPVIFAAVSLVYFTRFAYTAPLQTAVIFVSFAILMDFFVVALLVQRSLEMFTSLLGTWIPFGLMFTSTYLTGLAIEKRTGAVTAD